MEDETERTIPVYVDKYEVQFYDSSWKVIGRWDGFDDDEVCLCSSTVRLYGKVYLALGTSTFQGPENECKGRCVLLELVYKVGQTASGQFKKMLKLKSHDRKETGPITQITSMDDLLVECIGEKVRVGSLSFSLCLSLSLSVCCVCVCVSVCLSVFLASNSHTLLRSLVRALT